MFCDGCGDRIEAHSSSYECAADSVGGCVLGGRTSYAGGVFVTVAGAGVAETGTGVAEAVPDGVLNEVVAFQAASFRPIAVVSCVVAESLE